MSDYFCFFSGHFFCITVHRCTAMHDHEGVMYTHQSNILQDIAKQRKMKEELKYGPGPQRHICIEQGPHICESGIQRVQALADISRSALCCHNNETRAPIANPPNSAQLDDPLPFPKLHPGPCSSVGMQRGTDRRTDGRDQYTFRLGYASREM